MPVATTVVAEAFVSTRIAGITVSTVGLRAALLQSIQGSHLKCVGVVLLYKSSSKQPDYIG
jgi:hypothetical protein